MLQKFNYCSWGWDAGISKFDTGHSQHPIKVKELAILQLRGGAGADPSYAIWPIRKLYFATNYGLFSAALFNFTTQSDDYGEEIFSFSNFVCTSIKKTEMAQDSCGANRRKLRYSYIKRFFESDRYTIYEGLYNRYNIMAVLKMKEQILSK